MRMQNVDKFTRKGYTFKGDNSVIFHVKHSENVIQSP